MRKLTKPSPTASPLMFELDPEPLQETLTGLVLADQFRDGNVPAQMEPLEVARRPARKHRRARRRSGLRARARTLGATRLLLAAACEV
jgi:hypothetical protein